jgi:ribosome biogenesis GTPase A
VNAGILEMQKLFPRCSCVVEVHDARIPFTGRNPLFDMFRSRHVLVLNKADLANQRAKKVRAGKRAPMPPIAASAT